MSERKVLNKYFPPDFDPSKIVRVKGMGKKQQVVRLMAPFSMRCNTCGEYIYKGKKFNARKETADGETYFGIKIFRFYIKCTQCSAEITFKTDPKNTDYVAEHGAMRNFEPWRDSGEIPETEEERLERLEAEHAADDPMAELESKTVDSKREMDILDKLQEIRNKNARFERADKEHVLDSVSSRPAIQGVDEEYETREAEARRKLEQEEDEAEIRRVFSKIPAEGGSIMPSIELDEALEDEDAETDITAPSEMTASTSSMPPPPVPRAAVIKRKLDDVEPDALSLLSEEAKRFASTAAPVVPKKKKKGMDPAMAAKLGIKIKDGKGKGKA